MKSLQDSALNFNNSMQFDFNGGNVSSDTGLLAIRSFAEILGIKEHLASTFQGERLRKHSLASIIEQLMYSSIAGYPHDDDADKLREDPVFTSILGKEALASQPTVSRCPNGFSKESLDRFNELLLQVLEKAYRLEEMKHIVLDIDSTYVQTYGKQENRGYNYHYSSTGFHPLVVYNGLTGDLLKVELRVGNIYTSKNAREFLDSILIWLKENFPNAGILIRGDSGFATPEMYQLAEDYDADYLIRLKQNATLSKLSDDLRDDFHNLYANQFHEYCVLYDSFYYQDSSWDIPRRVVVKVERKAGELHARTGYIVTSLTAEPKVVLKAYNLMNLMKRLVLPREFLKSRMLSLRSWLVKIGARTVRSDQKITFRLSPYMVVFLKTMERINNLCFA